jgi:hypothetical protein
MSLRNFLTVAAVIAFVFGLSFLLIPGSLLAMYGVALDPVGTVVGRLFGALLIGFGTLNWLTRDATNAETARPVLLANLVADALGAILTFWYQINGQIGINALGWSTVVIYLLLALGLAYFLLMPQARPMAGAGRKL